MIEKVRVAAMAVRLHLFAVVEKSRLSSLRATGMQAGAAVAWRWRTGWLRSERTAKFLRETGSVTFGVLIALGLGAIATEIGWRVEVMRGRAAMAEELGEIIGQAQERLKLGNCIERRLDLVADLVDAAEASGRLPPLGPIGAPPFRTWTHGVYDNAVSAGTTAHLGRADQDNLSAIYDFVNVIAASDQRALEQWTRLAGIQGRGRPLGQEEAANLREAIGLARVSDRLVQMSGLRLQQIADAYGFAYSRDAMRQYASREPAQATICRPVSTRPSAHSGQAPFDGAVERVRTNPITRDGIGL
jgi:hypothetical protein